MTTFEELDQLSSQELHDRAVKRAKRHLDARFFWEMIQITPAADASHGDFDEATDDVLHWSRQALDAVTDETPAELDGRRAFYIDYLLKHDA